MIGFTITILSLVFRYRVKAATCPYPELCPATLNHTTSTAYYYVNVASATLAFVASWSSTISFSLVGLLMSLFSYIVAWQLVDGSADAQKELSILPTPYQMNFIIRFLNGEVLAFMDIISYRAGKLFSRSKRGAPEKQATSKILRAAIFAFLFGIILSVPIQGADTWLHIATNSVNIMTLAPELDSTYQYSRGLAPWCLTKPTLGSKCSKNFWSCGMKCTLDEEGEVEKWDLANLTTVYEVIAGKSKDHTVLNYTDSNGTQFAIAAPANVPSDIDWEANSFGISTQCRPIPFSSCDVLPSNGTAENPILPFNCSRERSGIDMAGQLYYWNHQMRYLDFHKYIQERPPFSPSTISGGPSPDGMDYINTTAPYITDNEANGVFNNPWHFVSAVAVYEENALHSKVEDLDVWRPDWVFDFLMVLCNTTGRQNIDSVFAQV